MKNFLTSITFLSLVFISLTYSQSVNSTVAIKAGEIITVAGDDIEKGVIVVKNGKISAVGKEKDVEIPWDAKVIEAADKVVMPGMIEAHTSRGVDRPNENVPNVPFVSTFDSIDPVNAYFEDALRDGVTTMLVIPGNETMIGGQGVIVKPYGRTTEAMLVKRSGGLKISLKPRPGSSRMGHIYQLRKAFADLHDYLNELKEKKADEKAEKEKKKKEEAKEKEERAKPKAASKGKEVAAGEINPDEEDIDERRRAMVDLIQGRLRAFVYCQRASDVLKAIELAEKNELKMVLVLSSDCYKAADIIARKKLPVILDPNLVVWETDEDEEREVMKIVPLIFHKAGVKFAFQTNSSALGSRFLWFQAATAVKYGMSREEALKAITLYPAEIIGIEDRVGSIEKGKDANLVLLTGDPLDSNTWVDTVLIEGKIVYEREKDKRLKKLLRGAKGGK